jgi:hypothetical protein
METTSTVPEVDRAAITATALDDIEGFEHAARLKVVATAWIVRSPRGGEEDRDDRRGGRA